MVWRGNHLAKVGIEGGSPDPSAFYHGIRVQCKGQKAFNNLTVLPLTKPAPCPSGQTPTQGCSVPVPCKPFAVVLGFEVALCTQKHPSSQETCCSHCVLSRGKCWWELKMSLKSTVGLLVNVTREWVLRIFSLPSASHRRLARWWCVKTGESDVLVLETSGVYSGGEQIISSDEMQCPVAPCPWIQSCSWLHNGNFMAKSQECSCSACTKCPYVSRYICVPKLLLIYVWSTFPFGSLTLSPMLLFVNNMI